MAFHVVGRPLAGSVMVLSCHGLAGHGLVRPWIETSLGCVVYAMVWPCSGLATGWAGHGLGLPMAELDMSQSGYGLLCPRYQLAMGWIGQGLGWPSAVLHMAWVGQMLGWTGHVLLREAHEMVLAGHLLVCVGLTIGRASHRLGWPWTGVALG